MADITAARYNDLQGDVANLLGKGTGDQGYGQALESYQVGQGDVIEADHMRNLYNDLKKLRVHQTATVPSEIALVTSGNIIEESNATNRKGIAQFESLASSANTNRLDVGAGVNLVESTTASSSTNTDWNGTIRHDVTVTFKAYTVTNGDGSTTSMSAADARRVFFNAGGEILFDPNLASGGSGSIITDWRNLLNAVGTVRFRRSNTTNAAYPATSGGTGGTSRGSIDLDGTFRTIYTRNASSYSANDYTIDARQTSSSVIQFRIYFRDDKGANPNFDEAVTPTTYNYVKMYRPNDADSVTFPTAAISFSTTRALG